MDSKHAVHRPRHARRRVAARHSRVSAPLWFVSGACAVLALLSVVTVVFSGGTGPGSSSGGQSRIVYVHGAGQSAGTVSVRIPDTADTFVNYAASKKNYNTSDRLVASGGTGSRKIAYLRFNLPDFNSAKLQSATLTLTRDLHHLSGPVQLKQVSAEGWQPAQVTAVRRPQLGRTLDTVQTNRSMSAVSFSVTDQVRKASSVAFGVTSPIRDNTVRFRSREAATGAPVLVLTLTEQAPPVTSSSAPTTTTTTPAPTDSTTPAPADSTTSAPTDSTTSGPGWPARPDCSVSRILVPSCGRWWGAAPRAFMSTPVDQGIAQLEAQTGQPFDVVHAYHRNDELFPNAAERAIALQPGHNRLLFLNWKPAMDMSWRAVANGAADARIDREANYLNTTWQHPFFLTIWHEPENDVNPTPGSGMTADDYAAMFRHVVQRLRADGVNNAITVMTYMNYLPWEEKPWFDNLYPGDDVVDWIATDSYIYSGASGYGTGDFNKMMNRSSSSFPGFYKWATTTHPGQPIMLGEWGVFNNAADPAGQADFYRSVQAELHNYPDLHALIDFDMPKPPNSKGPTTPQNPAAIAALAALRDDPQVVTPRVVYGPNMSVTG